MRPKPCAFACLLGVAVMLLSCRGAMAEDKPSEEQSGWQRLFQEHAADYRIVVDGNETAEIKLVPKPILQWSQPVRGGADGAVFVWVQGGRPVAIGTLFIWPMEDGRQGISHELHSLATRPFVATWRERKWTPPRDSVVWTRLPGAPSPAATADQRLRQMREAARTIRGRKPR